MGMIARSVVVLAVAGSALAGCGDEVAVKDEFSRRPDGRAIVVQGQKIYAEHCASCHGADLEGQPNWRVRDDDGYLPAPPHDRTGQTWHHTDEHLIELTKHGLARFADGDYKSRMPKYDGVLSDSQIIAVLSYIKSRWPEDIRKRHDRLNRAASFNKAI